MSPEALLSKRLRESRADLPLPVPFNSARKIIVEMTDDYPSETTTLKLGNRDRRDSSQTELGRSARFLRPPNLFLVVLFCFRFNGLLSPCFLLGAKREIELCMCGERLGSSRVGHVRHFPVFVRCGISRQRALSISKQRWH